jgi:hypothetical protein
MLEPKNFNEANKDDHWVKAMNDELDQIEKNNTWEMVQRPEGKNVIGSKWIFKNKLNEQGQAMSPHSPNFKPEIRNSANF